MQGCRDAAALAYRLRQPLQHLHRAVPADATIGDALPIAQRLSWPQFLPAAEQMAFHHHAENAPLAGGYPRGKILDHRRLVLRVLAAVGMAGIDHHAGAQAGLADRSTGSIDAGRVVIRRLAAAQDHVAVAVAAGGVLETDRA